MTIKAYVLIEIEVGKTKEATQALQKIKEIKSADAVTGPYDIIAVVEGADTNAIGDIITKQVHQTSGVTRTLTCIVMKLV